MTGKQTDLDFRLVEPAPVFGCVMNAQALPERATLLLSEIVGEGFSAMDVQIIHHEVDRPREGIAAHDGLQSFRKFRR